ncbi:hypothetical protein D5086_026498 [Populus alba]|uniref:Uncharacterized protein n=1 Tax=Populus alba TaxID=43335 RepID=A0ACC4B209_POPAL
MNHALNFNNVKRQSPPSVEITYRSALFCLYMSGFFIARQGWVSFSHFTWHGKQAGVPLPVQTGGRWKWSRYSVEIKVDSAGETDKMME